MKWVWSVGRFSAADRKVADHQIQARYQLVYGWAQEGPTVGPTNNSVLENNHDQD